jgi:hypothetical protein
LRLYTPLRLRGSRENCTPFALLTSVELRPSVSRQFLSFHPEPIFQLTGNLPGKIVRDSGGHFVCMECGYGRCRLLVVESSPILNREPSFALPHALSVWCLVSALTPRAPRLGCAWRWGGATETTGPRLREHDTGHHLSFGACVTCKECLPIPYTVNQFTIHPFLLFLVPEHTLCRLQAY